VTFFILLVLCCKCISNTSRDLSLRKQRIPAVSALATALGLPEDHRQVVWSPVLHNKQRCGRLPTQVASTIQGKSGAQVLYLSPLICRPSGTAEIWGDAQDGSMVNARLS
jgi:hypothetical protein